MFKTTEVIFIMPIRSGGSNETDFFKKIFLRSCEVYMGLGLEERIKIFKRSSINILDLSDMGLIEIPENIRGLKNVEYLNLISNEIYKLPPWIIELSSIRMIMLDNNRLKDLPAEIGFLPRLELLSLSNNDLETLPETLIQRHPVFLLDLGNNPRLGIPESLLNSRNSKEILRYYFESRNKKGRPLLELIVACKT